MTNKTSLPLQSPCIPTPYSTVPAQFYRFNYSEPLIQPVYTRNSTLHHPQAARSPFSSSPLQFALLRGRSFSDSWPGLLLFYGEHCDPTISLRGISAYKGRQSCWFDLLLLFRGLSQVFQRKTFCSWWASRSADLIQPGGHLTRWEDRYLPLTCNSLASIVGYIDKKTTMQVSIGTCLGLAFNVVNISDVWVIMNPPTNAHSLTDDWFPFTKSAEF